MTNSDVGINLMDETLSKKILHRKDEFLRSLFHDIRTPLASVKEASCLLWEEILGPLNESQKKCSDIARKEILKVQKTLDPILELSLLETNRLGFSLVWVDLNEFAQFCLTYFEKKCLEKKNNFTHDFDVIPGSVLLDFQILKKGVYLVTQIFFEYLPTNSPISISFKKNNHSAELKIRAETNESNLNILQVLLQNNAGIPREVWKKSNESFSMGFVGISYLELLGLTLKIESIESSHLLTILIPKSLLKFL